MENKSLWGEEFLIPETTLKNKKTIQKSISLLESKDKIFKQCKSKNTSLKDKLTIINKEVIRVLGKYKDNTLIIHTKQELSDYINKAIQNNIIAIDTETNNSLDTMTCKLMGGCIYTPGMPACYIPINHVDYETNERLDWQLTEQDIKEQFDRLKDTKILMHNGKFDYKVLNNTCNCQLNIYWDTMTAARMLDENERSAGLKQQFIDKINPDQERYKIDKLFNNVLYEQVEPDIFALYSATDAYMTYKLYEWQLEKFKDPSLKGVYSVFMNIEMPIITVVAKMELNGITIDKEYAERLNKKYYDLEKACDTQIDNEMFKYKETIKTWKLSPDANNKIISWKNADNELKSYFLNKSPILEEDILEFLKCHNNGDYKLGNKQDSLLLKKHSSTKLEKLSDPISLTSPTQLSILLYDILKLPKLETKNYKGNSKTGTGVDILQALAEKSNIPFINLILKKRTLHKIFHDFVEKLPNEVKDDGKIHCQFNSTGTDTGRFSSSNPNLQQIPAHNKEIRMMFCAPHSQEKYIDVEDINKLILNEFDSVLVSNEWIKVKDLKLNNILNLEDGNNKCNMFKIINIFIDNNRNYIISLIEC